MIKNEIFIIFADTDWGYIPVNKHQFALGISKYSKVIFIKKKLEISLRNLTALPNVLRKIICRVNKLNHNLTLYKPIGLPFAWYSVIRRVEKRMLTWDIRRIVGKQRPIVLYYHPLQIEYLKTFNEKISVYHCVDESTYDYHDERLPQNIVDAERILISSTDLAIFVSDPLRQRKKDSLQDSYVVPSGYNEELFSYKEEKKTDVPEELKELKHPIIGITGTLLDQLDLKIVLYLAQKNPAYNFVYLGPTGGDQDDTFYALVGSNNVHFLGYRTPYDVPRYVSKFDVCIMPHKKNVLNFSASPIKVFEYLALGKPVVSTPFPSLTELDHVIHFADGEEDFNNLLKQAIDDDNEYARLKRIEAVKEFTIESRVKQFLSIIETYLS